MTQRTGTQSERHRVIDTQGDRPFAATYVAVVVIEVVVLVGLWLFSQYFSG